MKPFDLKKARNGDPVITRNGNFARIICFDRLDPFPIVALMRTIDRERVSTYATERVVTYNSVGRVNMTSSEHPYDLMMAPKKVTKWVNYNTEDETMDKCTYSSEEDAQMWGRKGAIQISFEVEE